MTVWDFIKAIGIALALLVLNVAVAFGVVAVYSIAIEPGHDPSFYESAAQRIAPWSSVVAGIVLFFLAALWLAWRRAGRNGYLFAAAFALIYAALDVTIIVMSGAILLLGLIVTLSMLTKLGAALAGAWMARPSRRPA
jgi:hypothetical protein